MVATHDKLKLENDIRALKLWFLWQSILKTRQTCQIVMTSGKVTLLFSASIYIPLLFEIWLLFRNIFSSKTFDVEYLNLRNLWKLILCASNSLLIKQFIILPDFNVRITQSLYFHVSLIGDCFCRPSSQTLLFHDKTHFCILHLFSMYSMS